MAMDRDTPFRIAVIGNFSGNRLGSSTNSAQRERLRALQIDRDNFEMVMRKLEVGLHEVPLVPDARPLTIRFEDLDDFEPDDLYDELPIFAEMRNLRDRLLDDDSFQAAADEVLSWGKLPIKPAESGSSATAQSPSSSPAIPSQPGGLLDQMLDADSAPTDDRTVQSDWQRMIDDIVAPYLVPGADPRQAELLACVDAATQATMRTLLQHPAFRALEASWRALYLLVHRLETSPQLSIHLIDLSQSELAEGLLEADDLRGTRLHRLLVEQSIETPGGEPWSLVIGNYSFGPSEQDARLLGQLSRIAAAAGAPLIASATTALVACSGAADDPEFAESPLTTSPPWQQLRHAPAASYVGLAWPRFLLRLPYGSQSNPIEQFDFEELPPTGGRDLLLWGNSAFLAGLLIGECFAEDGWNMDPRNLNPIERLPVWSFEDDGETTLHPCGEFLLTDTKIEYLQTLGLIPLVSIRDRDEARLGGLYSLRGQFLSGPWSS